MPNTTLEHILMKKFKEGHLAGFYVLKSPFLIGDPDLFLETWITGLLSKFLGTQRGISEKKAMESLEQGHPDILFLRKKDQKATYIWNKQENDFKDFLKFLYFRPFELPHKFIIFTQAHLIPKDISNKLLKSLEDIPEKTTLFFLLPAQKSLLPTISSRALEVTVPLPEETKRKVEQEAAPKFFPSQDIGYKIIPDISGFFKTIDGGLNWMLISNIYLERISFPTKDVGYASDGNNIFKTNTFYHRASSTEMASRWWFRWTRYISC